MLRSLVAFLTSREFAVNFFANLGGAMAGVLLAFWMSGSGRVVTPDALRKDSPNGSF